MAGLIRYCLSSFWVRFACIGGVLGYVIAVGWLYSPWQKDRWYRQLLMAADDERLNAATSLAWYGGENQLFAALRHDSAEVRMAAERALDSSWFSSAGEQAAARLVDAEVAMNSEHYEQAMGILDEVLREHPEYIAGLHRRSELYWKIGRPAMALRDAERVVQLEPRHYGAWQSLGLCYLHFNRPARARMCVERYLQIQPHYLGVRKWLKDCEKLEREETKLKPRKPVEVLL